MSAQQFSLLRLHVLAEADPGALVRALEPFQNLNILPRRVIAEFETADVFHIQVDVAGMSEHSLTLIAAKIGQVPSVLSAYWHHT